jgi:pimeloyl-ACP methyl ester carboxylesterase
MRFRPYVNRWIVAVVAITGLATILSGYHADIPLADLQGKYANEASRYINILGTSVHYRDEGQGPLLVLLHGTAASLHTWDRWVDILQQDFRIVRLDLPGFGLTGPDAGRDYSIRHYVNFVHAFAQALELPRFHLAGNSLGGEIAWNYALGHPQRVDHLILIDAAGHPDSSRTGVPLVFRLARLPVIKQLFTVITPRSIHRSSILDVYGDPGKVTDALIDRYFELSLRPGNRQAFIDRAQIITAEPGAEPRLITQPTLILWGAKDRWIPLADGEAFARDIHGAELRVYPNAGHVPMEEIPDKTAAAVLGFLVN